MKRNKAKIRSTRDQKYELNRSSWTTYAKSTDMYNHNYSKMEETEVATLLPSPEMMYKEGKIVEESEAYGCTCSHSLDHPEYFVVMDEVGRNINMK